MNKKKEIPQNTKEEIIMNPELLIKGTSTFPIVGIGASAGGLSAFEAFFSGMPADKNLGMAFVLIQHLSPEHKSMLPDIIKRYTNMNVYEIEDGVSIAKDCVYIIPPNKDIALLNGKLHLLDINAERGMHRPIDFFFRTLAQDQGVRAVCIILSGTGSDGTLGLQAVKGECGLVMVQSPDSAEFNGMPCSAIETGIADFVLPPAEMPLKLLAYAEQAFDKFKAFSYMPLHDIENVMEKIFIMLRTATGHDFTKYKRSTITRRIERRMAVNQIEKMSEYVLYLQKNKKEIEVLFKDMLIGVTYFFRDTPAFMVLEEKAIGQICTLRPSGETLRVWVPGCSTGEEAYSIAILFMEKMEELKKNFQLQIFATDIDSQALAFARAGNYSASISADVSKERLEKYFTLNQDAGDTYRIKKDIRDLLIFSEQNYIKDPPFSKIDLISCRNSLIYMTSELQKKVFPMFHYALNPSGFLFLGTSESVGDFIDFFDEIDRKYKLYQKKEGYKADMLPSIGNFIHSMTGAVVQRQPQNKVIEKKITIKELAEQSIIRQYAPAFVVVNEKKDVLYVYGHTGKYLEPAQGDSNLNIINMARAGLHQELTTALYKVITTNVEAVSCPGLHVQSNDSSFSVNITVQKLDTALFLVIFEDSLKTDSNKLIAHKDAEENKTDSEIRIAALEHELRAKEEYLKSILEDRETSNEELKSTNEEMQSVNEELQSTNEELETSKEELQSLNEELSTVNNELQIKVSDLSRVNNDMSNLMASTGVGTIFVDHQLNIQRFTPNAAKVVNMIKTDVGRPLGHIASNMVGYTHLIDDTQSVLDTLIPKEVEVQSKSGTWYLLRILPYRTTTNVIEGAVITFVDITEIKKAHEVLMDNETLRHLAVVIRDSSDAVTVHNLEGDILEWNPSAEKMYGWSKEEALTMNIRDIIPEALRNESIETAIKLAKSGTIEPCCTQRTAKDGKILNIMLTSSSLVNDKNEIYAIATTERKLDIREE